MNKKYLIVGGVSAVASLAAGGAGGYLVAKRKFDKKVDGLIALEVEKTKKYFSVLLMEAKKAPIVDVLMTDKVLDMMDAEETERSDEVEKELTEADEKAIAKGRKVLGEAKEALVNYQGFAQKPDLSTLVTSNIFTKEAPKKRLPPRDPTTGHFMPKKDQEEEGVEQTPYLISQEEFLLNDGEFEQKNLRYFKQDDTLIDVEMNDEVVENAVVGAVNLTLFPDVSEGETSIICVRNEGLEIDYEIQLMTESLTDYMGLGENEGDDNEYALQE